MSVYPRHIIMLLVQGVGFEPTMSIAARWIRSPVHYPFWSSLPFMIVIVVITKTYASILFANLTKYFIVVTSNTTKYKSPSHTDTKVSTKPRLSNKTKLNMAIAINIYKSILLPIFIYINKFVPF